MAKTIVSWQAFPSLPPRALLAPKTPFPFPFKRLPGTLDDSLLNQVIAYLTKGQCLPLTIFLQNVIPKG